MKFSWSILVNLDPTTQTQRSDNKRDTVFVDCNWRSFALSGTNNATNIPHLHATVTEHKKWLTLVESPAEDFLIGKL